MAPFDFLELNFIILGVVILAVFLYLVFLINKRRRKKFLHENNDKNSDPPGSKPDS